MDTFTKQKFEDEMILSNLVTGLRIENGMSQKELAEHLDTTEEKIALIESGKFLAFILREYKKQSSCCIHCINKTSLKEESVRF